MKRLGELGGELAERLDLPEEALLGAARLTVTSGRRALIENHHGLLEYGAEQITVSTGRGRIILRGGGLVLSAMNQRELLICGRISSVEWE